MNVIITGATRGIGYAIATVFASAGYNLAVCARSSADLDILKKNFSRSFPKIQVETRATDIGDIEQVKDFGKWLLALGFIPDILINNAGYFTPSTITTEEDGLLEKMININLSGAYHLTRLLLPAMIERKTGHIFNVCSIASFKAMANAGAYGISKFALYGFTKHLREEMKPYGIKVTAISPGATFTSSWDESGVNHERLIEAIDVARMILASSQLSPSAAVEDIIIRPQQGDL